MSSRKSCSLIESLPVTHQRSVKIEINLREVGVLQVVTGEMSAQGKKWNMVKRHVTDVVRQATWPVTA